MKSKQEIHYLILRVDESCIIEGYTLCGQRIEWLKHLISTTDKTKITCPKCKGVMYKQ